VALGEEPETIEAVIEPFLIRSGFLARTQRGREITQSGIDHLAS
jgi:Holliday junction DNA helicase RuvB